MKGLAQKWAKKALFPSWTRPVVARCCAAQVQQEAIVAAAGEEAMDAVKVEAEDCEAHE